MDAMARIAWHHDEAAAWLGEPGNWFSFTGALAMALPSGVAEREGLAQLECWL
jgi:hypothetical protein